MPCGDVFDIGRNVSCGSKILIYAYSSTTQKKRNEARIINNGVIDHLFQLKILNVLKVSSQEPSFDLNEHKSFFSFLLSNAT